jgi:hypothetical protein
MYIVTRRILDQPEMTRAQRNCHHDSHRYKARARKHVADRLLNDYHFVAHQRIYRQLEFEICVMKE